MGDVGVNKGTLKKGSGGIGGKSVHRLYLIQDVIPYWQ